jgi:hypothetical protein
MDKTAKRIILLILSSFIMAGLIGCSNGNNSKDAFNIEQFEKAMKDKGCSFEIKDAGQDFLPTERKRMLIGNEVLEIYLYSSNEKMEKDAKAIGSGGNSYNSLGKSVLVDWVAPPHFYKKGNLIVQYVGEDK